MKNHESLKVGALIGHFSYFIKAQIWNISTNRVLSSSEVICCIFFAWYQIFRMEHLSISASANFINDSGLEINHDWSRDILAAGSFSKESAKRLVIKIGGVWVIIFIWISVRNSAIGLDSMLEWEQFPTCISSLYPCLAEVKTYNLSHIFNLVFVNNYNEKVIYLYRAVPFKNYLIMNMIRIYSLIKIK